MNESNETNHEAEEPGDTNDMLCREFAQLQEQWTEALKRKQAAKVKSKKDDSNDFLDRMIL